jgi:hypothetical protein
MFFKRILRLFGSQKLFKMAPYACFLLDHCRYWNAKISDSNLNAKPKINLSCKTFDILCSDIPKL